jgi:asparagine synthase (glutamine-hydrolysing)
MCGIAGFVSAAGRADDSVLHAMLSAIRHRGPDALGGFVERGVALGCARLSIVDLPGGTQPAVSPDRRTAVVFNGEIYNYRDLRDRLVETGVSFRTNSEVETLLAMYAAHGEDMFRLLHGQFAIAIWDGKRDRLVIGRDRFGIRPLFWTRSGHTVAFASEVKAIAAHPDVALSLDARSLVQTFRFWTNVGDTSAFEGIHQLPPAHYIVIEGSGHRLERYWQWPLSSEVEPLVLADDEAYFEMFVEQMLCSVERRRMADVPIAGYVSGGIDSTVVAMCLQCEMSPERLKTYSVTFEDPEYDEQQAQRLVSDSFGFDHTSVHVRSADIGRVFPDVVWHAETPLFRTAPTPMLLLSRQVHKDGIKVVMTGEGADEVLLGYDLFRETAIRRFWSRDPGSQGRGSLLKRLYAYLPQFRNPRYFNLLLDYYRPTLEDRGDPHYAMAVRWENGRALEPFFSGDMRAFVERYDPVTDLERWLPAGYTSSGDVERAQCVEVLTLLSNYLLSSQGDRMSMANSVEGRYPYLDHRFVEFAARLPERIKLRGMKDKFILRHAFKAVIPEAVRARPKVAYQAPDLAAFISEGRAPEYVEDLLSSKRIAEVGLFDPAQVLRLLDKGKAHKLSRIGTRDNMAFVLVLSTMLLDELFVRRDHSAALRGRGEEEMVMV